MRIYHRADFLDLPEGTIYAKGKPAYFESLCVKGETWSNCNDFTTRALVWFESKGGEDQGDKFYSMLDDGASVPISGAYGRDGCFDDDDIFLVYESDDLDELVRVIAKAKGVTP